MGREVQNGSPKEKQLSLSLSGNIIKRIITLRFLLAAKELAQEEETKGLQVKGNMRTCGSVAAGSCQVPWLMGSLFLFEV